MIGLQPGEISIMHALADGRWRTGVELAGLTDLPPFSVRSMLAELRRRQLVQRGQDVDSVGTWSLTSTGRPAPDPCCKKSRIIATIAQHRVARRRRPGPIRTPAGRSTATRCYRRSTAPSSAPVFGSTLQLRLV
jgi:hypothetical protein